MTKKKEKTSQILIRKLLSKYRLVVLNEDTFEEQFFFKLSRFNVIIISTLILSFFIIGTFFLISYTSLREYIPGYPSTELRLNAVRNAFRLDSITIAMQESSLRFQYLQKALSGDVDSDLNLDENKANDLDRKTLIVKKNISDSLLREEVYQEDKYNINSGDEARVNFVLYPPAIGEISQIYNFEDKHYGIDIILSENDPIKAVNEGTVIFSEWSAETGYVIIIEHPYNLISVYKHNSSLSKTQGDYVKTGEVIATAGNTGEYSTGWHLHFELWSQGYPLDPVNFIDFKID